MRDDELERRLIAGEFALARKQARMRKLFTCLQTAFWTGLAVLWLIIHVACGRFRP